MNEKVWKDAKSIFQQHFHRRRRRRIVRSLMWCGWTHATECVFPRFFYPDRLHSVDPRNNLTTNTSGQNSISLKGVVLHLRWWMSTITAGRKMRRGMGWMSMICLRSPRPPSLLYLRHCTTSFRQVSWHRLWGWESCSNCSHWLINVSEIFFLVVVKFFLSLFLYCSSL